MLQAINVTDFDDFSLRENDSIPQITTDALLAKARLLL